jgi:peptidoglycan/LPS O-acetylase OafA/YrhL
VTRANNFDFLRLFAAAVVVIGHSFVLGVIGHSTVELLRVPIATYGVYIFFSISGYLITGSWLDDPNPRRYAAKRFLRIIPALFVVVIVATFVLGPFLSSFTLQQYFENTRTYNYLRTVALYIIYDLPGVFAANPYPGVVNGSLWSLPPEVFMYIVTPLCMLIYARRTAWIYSALCVVFACLSLYLEYHHHGLRWVVYATDVQETCKMAGFFMAGAAICSLGNRVSFKAPYIALAIAIFVLTRLIPWNHEVGFVLAPVSAAAFTYAIIGIGQRSTPVISRAGRYGDFSYGLYLYAFPVQQIIAKLLPGISLLLANLGALLVTLALAYISWHVVEQPVLRLKPSSAKNSRPTQSPERLTAAL